MNKLKLFISMFAFVVSSAQASGVMQLDGVVAGFDAEKIEVNDGRNIYSIDKKFVPAEVKSMKSGTKVSLHIPFNAVKNVRKLQK